MLKKKVNEMTEAELSAYIRNNISEIEDNLKKFYEYNNDRTISYLNFLSEDNADISSLMKYAYETNNIKEYVTWVFNKQLIIDSIMIKTDAKPKRGEIWTCELGKNIGSEENKIRPVIIIQNNTGNEKSPTTIIVPISNRPKKIAVHIELRKSDYILLEDETEEITGTILCEQIKVVSKARLGRHIATLESEFITNVLNPKLKKSIDL